MTILLESAGIVIGVLLLLYAYEYWLITRKPK
jgi:hypothetical protein